MLSFPSLIAQQNVSYYNINLDEGLDYTFVLVAIDSVTGSPLDLTDCTLTLTATELSKEVQAFIITNTEGNIVVDLPTGTVTVTIPGSASSGLYISQFSYDLVVTDIFLVSCTLVRGLLTINSVA